MSIDREPESKAAREIPRGRVWLRLAVVVLLISLAELSTLAKIIQYFPEANPAQYVSVATKMKIVHARVVLDGDRQLPVSRVCAPPAVWPIREDRLEAVVIPAVGVTLSMQHRSPPALTS